MADKKDEGQGAFYLGKRFEEAEPGLGRLHAAWHVETKHPALLLFPADEVQWSPRGTWEVRLDCQPKASTLSLTVVRSPDTPEVAELADLVVVMSAAVQRVEESPEAQTHLFGDAVNPVARAAWMSRRPGRLRAAIQGVALTGVALALGACLFLSRSPAPAVHTTAMTSELDAPLLSSGDDSPPNTLSYRLPALPFRNQAIAPCKPKSLEVEINGGCWMELAQKPPCADVVAEYQGKCFIPVSKERNKGRLPQSSEP